MKCVRTTGDSTKALFVYLDGRRRYHDLRISAWKSPPSCVRLGSDDPTPYYWSEGETPEHLSIERTFELNTYSDGSFEYREVENG